MKPWNVYSRSEEHLKNRIQQTKARLRSQKDKDRTGRLIAWGVAIEQKLAQEEITEDRMGQ
jgi:hypothetical protein